MQSMNHQNDSIGLFAQHPVAANLLMVIMLLSGAWALSQLNTQFFPNFEVEMVSVRTLWPGASAEDVERSITIPLEQALRSVDGLDKMSSTSSEGASLISLEFPEGSDMASATSRAEELVKTVRNLPDDAEDTEVSHRLRYEPVARLLVHGGNDIRELRPLARRFERELLARGIAKVELNGLPEEEMAIQLSSASLHDLGLSLGRVAEVIAAGSEDAPAGILGRDDVGRDMRSLGQRRSEQEFEQLPLLADRQGRLVRLGDVAQLERRPRPNQASLSFQGEPAVELQVQRSASADSLESARIMEQWLRETRPVLPPGIEIVVYDESWQLIADRINLLLKNGLGGLVLVVAILFLFLNGRVAFWVTLGIPISFMATLAIVWLAGGSINMISLFALIMALGIIVDDAIVVGEDALTHYQTGEHSLQAAEGGARRMLAPVLSSSLTTIAAFIPLMAISGVIGKILFAIPMVVICVILASLVESFYVLPGHLRGSFHKMRHAKASGLRRRLEDGFNRFRDGAFRPLVSAAVRNPGTTLASALACFVLAFSLLLGGRIGFTFFPSVEGNMVTANLTFVAGTPPQRVADFVSEVEKALYETDRHFGGGLVRVAQVATGQAFFNAISSQNGEQFASVVVELIPSDQREVRNEQFLKHWEGRFRRPPGLENMTLTSRKGGPQARDLEVKLTGASPDVLKAAALELSESLRAIAGVHGLEDDMPYGRQQLIFALNPLGEALGLTLAEVGRQLRGALDGYLVQIFTEQEEEIEVRVMLPDAERHRLVTLENINLTLPQGETVPLPSVLELKEQRGFKALRHVDGQLAVTLYADVDRSQNNANRIREQIGQTLLPELTSRYGISWEFSGGAEDQRETAADMKRGALFALAMIYIVLAWVFGSYGWPLVVMSVIPFGIVGALVGHWAMGIELTILSLFGLFGLSGIVVNDSIILVVFYKELRQQGMAVQEAVIEAACRRLRAVLLTSLTTIAGLTPLLFETSLQAQFLIPMATSIAFGLAFATFLILLMVPVLLNALERAKQRLNPSPAEALAEGAQ
jgi:multidrug efflux pump subunit AcrB